MNVTGERPYWTRKRQKNSNNEYECQYCHKICPNELYLRQHEWMHEGLKPLKCNMCDRSFCWYSTLTAHKRTHRKKDSLTTGPAQTATLSSHGPLSVTNGPPSISAPLHISFSPTRLKDNTSGLLNVDASSMRPREYRECERVRCPHCDRHFSTPSGLKYHLRTHVGLKPFTCEICGRLLSSKQGLDYHLRVHSGERPYRCGACDASFRNQTLLNAHYSRKHPHIKDIPVYFPVSPTPASNPETSPNTTDTTAANQQRQDSSSAELNPFITGKQDIPTTVGFATLAQTTNCNIVIPLYPFNMPFRTDFLMPEESTHQRNPDPRALDLSHKLEMEDGEEGEKGGDEQGDEGSDNVKRDLDQNNKVFSEGGQESSSEPQDDGSAPRGQQEVNCVNESPWQQGLKRSGLPSVRDKTKRAKLEATIKGIKGKVTGEKKVQIKDEEEEMEEEEEGQQGEEACFLPKILNVYSLRRDEGNTVPSEGDALGSEGKGHEEKADDVTVSSTSMLQEGDLKKQGLEINPDFEDLRRLADDEMSVMQNLVQEYACQTNEEVANKDLSAECQLRSGRNKGRAAAGLEDSARQCKEERDCEIDSSMQPDGIPKSSTISTQTGEHRDRGKVALTREQGLAPAYAEDERLQCKHCDIQFTDSVQHTLHSSWHHSEAEPFKCKGCRMDCGQRDKFFCHVTRMATSEHPPETISDAASSKVNAAKPTKNVGSGFECTYCGWKFSDVVLYTLHTSWHQNSEVPFYCKGCKTAYTSQEDLVCHITRIIISPH